MPDFPCTVGEHMDARTGAVPCRCERPDPDALQEPHTPTSSDDTHPVTWWGDLLDPQGWSWHCTRRACPAHVVTTGYDSEAAAEAAAQKHARKPHAPASGPDRGPRASLDAETAGADVEALRARLVGALHAAGFYEDPAFTATDLAAALLPLVVAYGHERAAGALRDAAREEYRVSEDCDNHCDDATRARLDARADEIAPRP